MDRSENISQLATALAKAQGAVDNAVKNKTNPHFRSSYADLGAVLDVVRKPMSDNGLCVVHDVAKDDSSLLMTTTLLHESGEWLSVHARATPKDGGPQSIGSIMTYLRRYTISAMLSVSQQDDDGNSSQGVDARGNGRPGKRELRR
tara:strand:- start:314 stop:751 length:438 start_codon:yes stop_codon:yes gene_type:complete